VSLDWEGWIQNGTIPFDAATSGALDASEVYVQLRTADRPTGALRAQLLRFDTLVQAPLAPSSGGLKAQGAGVFFVDTRSSTLQFWVYYTAPLDFVEVGATLNSVSNGTDVFPLPVGTVGFRRTGPYDRYNDPPLTYVLSASKQGVFRYAGTTYGSDVAAHISQGQFAVNIASNDARGGALTGVVKQI